MSLATNYGLDTDRVLAADSPGDALRRRLEGRYALDEFGGDPHLMDLLTPLFPLPVVVEHGERLPVEGPALLVANRGLGLLEPLAVVRAVRAANGRRARVVGAPDLPILGDADGPFNVVGPGAASPWQAVRRGGRVPIPVAGPGWGVARRVAEVAGAPIPSHVEELLRRGRTADGGRAVAELGLTEMLPTQTVLADLFAWATVTRLATRREAAA